MKTAKRKPGRPRLDNVTKNVTFEREIFAPLEELAKQQGRQFSNMVNFIVRQHLEQAGADASPKP